MITSAYLAASGDADVCALAARQARLPETRELGAALQRTLTGMRGDLTDVAQRRKMSLPKGLEEKKLALRDNLSILPGRVFDEGYAVAMVQDTRSMLQTLDAAARVDDADVRNIVTKYRQIQAEQRDSGRLLDRLRTIGSELSLCVFYGWWKSQHRRLLRTGKALTLVKNLYTRWNKHKESSDPINAS